MATAVHDVFEEHLGVIAALKDNYTRRDDVVSMENINTLREEIGRMCLAREDEVKDAIKELTRHVAKAEQIATYPRPQNAHSEHVAELTASLTHTREGLDELNAQLQDLQSQREGIKQNLAMLEERKKELERVKEVVEPLMRHRLSLYAHVSKIQWNLKNTDLISGTVNDPSSNNINDFDLGLVPAAPEFDTVDKLWNIIDGGATTSA